MKRIIRIQQNTHAPLHLTWLINNICTNACTYCPESLHVGRNHHYDWERARVFFQMLFERYPKIHCSVSGGEASVSPFLPEIVKTFYDAGHTIGITSNAAKPAAYWEEISQYLNYICFSYHAEFADAKFQEKVEAACMNTFVTVRVMMHPLHWQHCVEVYNSFVDHAYLHVEAVRIQDWSTNSWTNIYTDEQLEWFTNNVNMNKPLNHLLHLSVPDIMAKCYFDDGSIENQFNAVDYINAGMTNFYGYTCEIGLKELFVSWDGSVVKGNCDTDNIIGHIGDPEKIIWPTDPVVCDKTLCHCSTDVYINKWIDK
jgi:MoaA/NifB/PqqE/SkfB family radical SAM enzyme